MKDYDWEAEHDIRMLSEADDIRKNPARISRARAHIEEQKKALDAAAKKLAPESSGPRFNNGIKGKIRK